ncbi:Pvf2 [Drosophila busckii]|uniref:Pvf2 n=1 Tax=Drosophila busckii TaxID=30019 RepID=A0A0M3QTA9_DROBS|nr:uncharacterized protein LOC108608244 [Drosophila busckii]ALC38593.1 Pvf2 [Drosophila busckii]
MWRLLILCLCLLSYVAGNQHLQRVDAQNLDDDDYYNDNEPNDSINSDIHFNHDNWLRITTHSATSSPPPSEWQHLKRLVRHPYVGRQSPHAPHDNRLDGDAASANSNANANAAAAFDENEKGYQSDQAIGVLTRQKEQEVGTPEKVQSSLRQYQELTRNQLKDKATLHVRRMLIEGLCKLPQPRIIYMNNETSKLYSPRVTRLHRCDKYTGCCPDPTDECSVKSKETVELVFWVLEAGSQRAHAQTVQMTNHTECGCVKSSSLRSKRSSGACRCPMHFINFSEATQLHCRCDCHLNNATCQRLKNGEEGFALSERRCISQSKCEQPICNYGSYSQHSGRCPRPSQQQQQQRQREYG